ncbi:GntR family transcriptional regulator [Alcaligenaceae bacterium]|nr:GntR family transcriptional regulator [Alcaligenaceae bacterium]
MHGLPAPDKKKAAKRSTPRYAMVAKDLADCISGGKYPPGTLLPTEPQLSEMYGVSRQTVREALRRLADAGVVSRHPGRGTRVHKRPEGSNYSYQMGSLADISEYARDVPLTIDHIEQVTATGPLLELLACRHGTHWLRLTGKRTRRGDAAAVAISELFIRAAYPGIEKHLRELKSAIYVVLEEHYGEIIDEVHQEILAVAADAATAAALGLEEGAPALEVRRRFLGPGDRVVVLGRVIYPGHTFSYTARFRRETQA